MERRTVNGSLMLLGIIAILSYILVGNWRQFEAEHRLDPPASEARAVGAASRRPASPAPASRFAAIVDHHLFHPDRSNELPAELAEEAEEELGQVPVLMGTVGAGGEDYALMVSGSPGRSGGFYRRLKVGEALDGYTLVRVEADRVVMKTGTREVKVSITHRPRKPGRLAASPQASSARRRPTGVGSTGRTGAASSRQPARSGPATRPTDLPVGTVRDGMRLIAVPTPFGEIRRWVEDKSN